MSKQSPPLKTCPFCGHTPRMIFRKLWKEYFVACTNDGCHTLNGFLDTRHEHLAHRTPQAAATAWNMEFSRQLIEEPEMRIV